MGGRWLLIAIVAVWAARPVAAQTPLERVATAVALTRSVTVPQCRRATRADEIMVCATNRDSPYRLPPEVRDLPPDENTRAGRTVAVERFDLVHNDFDPHNTAPLRSAGLTEFELRRERSYAQHPDKGRVGFGGGEMPDVVPAAVVEVATELPAGVAGPR